MAIRLGVIQPGDYPDAVQRLDSGAPEFYFGVRESVDALKRLFDGNDHLVISLNAPKGETVDGDGCYCGLPAPALPQAAPQRIVQELWARRIVAKLKAYRPTHVLLRTGGIIGLHVASYCVKNRIPSLAVLANALNCTKQSYRAREGKFVRLLNDDCFHRAANFKRAAVQSMLDCGLRPEKAVAYEFKGAREPGQHPVKTLTEKDALNLVFASRITPEKGAEDVLAAARLLIEQGRRINLTMIGEGPAMASLRAQAAELPPGAVTFTGWLDNDEMFNRLLHADIAFAPTHHSFPEGLPMALTEALASRTPTVISDHPIFTSIFLPEEGVVIVPEKTPAALAEAVNEIANAPERYQRLSETTKDAFERAAAPASFTDVLEDWRQAVLGTYED